LRESIGSSTAKHESSSNGSNYNTSNNTSSDSGNDTNGCGSAISGFLFSARVFLSSAVDVALANPAVVLIITGNIKEYTTSLGDASGVVANVCGITHYRSVCARGSRIFGQRITFISSTQVIVVTESGRNRFVNTTKSSIRFTRIVGARVRIITGKRRPDTLILKRIGEINNTLIGRAGIQIITAQIHSALGKLRAEIGDRNFSSGRHASIGSALREKRNGESSSKAPSDGITK